MLIKIVVIGLNILLVACTLPFNQPTESVVVDEPQEPVESTIEYAPMIVEGPDPMLEARIKADILYAAKGAFDDDNLMLPAENNAYDRYWQVLGMDPTNEVALAGLDEIFMRYIELADVAMAGGQYDRAQGLLDRAVSIEYNNHEFVVAAQDRLAAARLIKINFYALNPVGITDQSIEILVNLWSLGQYIRNEGATFLITARNDEEGRWIYRVMRQSVDGYRLRGDITLGNEPGVLITIPQLDG